MNVVAHLNLLFCRSISTSKVTILGYGLLTTDARPLQEALNKQRFGVILVDESHYLKSRNAARSKILVPIIQNAKRAILLTGTPGAGQTRGGTVSSKSICHLLWFIKPFGNMQNGFVWAKPGGDLVISWHISHPPVIAHATQNCKYHNIINQKFDKYIITRLLKSFILPLYSL